MHLVLEGRLLARGQQPGVIGHRLAQRLDPRPLRLGEVAKHIGMDQVLEAGVADAEPHAGVVVADMGGDRAQPVVPGVAAAGLDAQLARRQIEFVMEHGNVAKRQLEETHRLADGAAGLVHVGRGLEQHDALPRQFALGGLALEAAPPRREAVAACHRVDRHEADVVAVALMLRAGIAQSDEQAHGGARPAPAYFFLSAAGALAAGALAPAAGAAAPAAGAAAPAAGAAAASADLASSP